MTLGTLSLNPITKEMAMPLFDDDLLYRSSEGETPKEFKLTCDYFVGAFEGDKLIGVFMGNMIGKKTSDVHIAFPEEHRSKAFELSKMYVKAIFKETTIERIETEIPFCFPDVIRFTEKVGFTKEGVKRKNYFKNNKLHNSQIMGILRGDKCLRL